MQRIADTVGEFLKGDWGRSRLITGGNIGGHYCIHNAFVQSKVWVHRTLITGCIQIGPMWKRALHFLTTTYSYTLSCLCKCTHFFSILTNLLRHLTPIISTVSLLNEGFSMPMTQRCHDLCCTIPYLFTTDSPTHFLFFLKKWKYLWFIRPHFEHYPFPVDSSITLDLWNKIISLLKLSWTLTAAFIVFSTSRTLSLWTNLIEKIHISRYWAASLQTYSLIGWPFQLITNYPSKVHSKHVMSNDYSILFR